MKRWSSTLAQLVLLATLTVLLPGRLLLSGEALWVEALVSFAPQYALLALLLACWQLWCGRRLRALACALLLVPDAALMLHAVWSPGTQSEPGAHVLEVYSANLSESQAAVSVSLDQVEALQPDLIWWSEFPGELNVELQARLAVLGGNYPFGFEMRAEGGRELRFLSRYPLRSRQTFEPARTRGRPALRLGLDIDGIQLVVFALHAHPPVSGWSLAARNETLTWVEQQLARYRGNALVIGDLNTSAYGPRFRQLIRRTGLACRAPWQCSVVSWPAQVPPLLTPIDHVLGQGALQVRNLRRGGYTGSDHYPVIADVVLF